MAIMKFGLPRQELPTTLVREVEELEERIINSFSGSFSINKAENIFHYGYTAASCWGSVLDLTINWIEGKLAFAVKNYDDIDDGDAIEEYNIVIQCGEENNLSILGGKLFQLPGKYISISDYSIDFARKEIILVGSCSNQSTMLRKKALKCILTIDNDPKCDIGLEAETRVFEDSYDGKYRCRNRSSFFYSKWFFNSYGPSDSESESESEFTGYDYDSWVFDKF